MRGNERSVPWSAKDCHRRIEHFLDILCLVAERAHTRSLSGEERSAVQAALQYFHVGGERQTADEEESLFSRLRGKPSAGLEQIDRLESDHHLAADLHGSVDRLYTARNSVGALQEDEQQRLLSQTRRLKQPYAEHIQAEEMIVFPHALQTLDSRTIAEIGREFPGQARLNPRSMELLARFSIAGFRGPEGTRQEPAPALGFGKVSRLSASLRSRHAKSFSRTRSRVPRLPRSMVA